MKGKITIASGATAVLILMAADGFSAMKPQRTFPTAEEQERIYGETHFPVAKADTSSTFLPQLRELLAREVEEPTLETARREAAIIREFVDNTYAELPLCKMSVKVDFASRQEGLHLISHFGVVRTGTNDLYAVADYIGKGVFVSTATREEDRRALQKIRMHLCYTPEQLAAHKALEDDYRIVPALFTRKLDGFAKEYWDEFEARDQYNAQLAEFRGSVLACFCRVIKSADFGETDCRAIWDEFCRRAKASDLEKSAAEKSVEWRGED